MVQEVKASESILDDIKNKNEDELHKVIEKWYNKIHTQSMRLGAKYISAGIFGAIQKHLNKQSPSLRDYERCIKDIRKIIAVQLTVQNDDAKETTEDTTNDRTTE
jgi:hypothetical protein